MIYCGPAEWLLIFWLIIPVGGNNTVLHTSIYLLNEKVLLTWKDVLGETAHFYCNQTYVKVLWVKEWPAFRRGMQWTLYDYFSLFTLVKELCCAGSEVSCNLINCFNANPSAAPACTAAQMCGPSISCWCDTGSLHSKGTVESDRTVCTIEAALSRASLGTSEPQMAGQVQTSLKESLGSNHVEECTGADTRQQSIPANTWSVWRFAGLMSMTGTCGIVFGCQATKSKVRQAVFLCLSLVLQFAG